MRYLIPNKNKVFENETTYLEEKYRQGLKLKAKGMFFYQFAPVSPEEVTYEIDLVPRGINDEELHITGWEVVETEPILYKKLKKVYCLSSDSENRLLIDEKMRLDYYKRVVFLWSCISIIMILLPFLLLFAEANFNLATAAPWLMALAPYLLLLAIPLIIYAIRKCLPFNQAIPFLREKLGEETNLPVFYIISFLNPTPEQTEELDDNFSAIGTVLSQTQRENQAYYYLKSLINHIPEMKQELLNITSIQEENIKIVRHSGAYSMPWIVSGWDKEEL